MYIDFNKEDDKEDPKLKVGDHVRISNYKNVFVKGYVILCYYVIWAYVISDLNGQDIVWTF